MASIPFIGSVIGALAGGICFIVFGLMRAAYAGGLSAVVILSKLQGGLAEQSLFVRIMVAAGMIVGIVLGLGVAMGLGGLTGGVIEYALIKMAWN
ncbi:MAG: hypothetical protein ACM3MB_03360 [Acidobacteriota bacterium]